MKDVIESSEYLNKFNVIGVMVVVLVVACVIGWAVWKMINRHLGRRESENARLQQQFIKDRDELLKDYRADRARYELSLKEIIATQQKMLEQCLEAQHKLTTSLNQSAQVINEGNRIIQQNSELLRMAIHSKVSRPEDSRVG